MNRVVTHFLRRGISSGEAGTTVSRAVLLSHSLSAVSHDHRHAQWHRAISNAEKVVGAPSSTFTWKLLTSETGIGAAGHLRKLLGTTHPVIKTIKKLIYNGRNQLQTRGLIVLLLSRCAGHIEGSPQMLSHEWEEAMVDGVTQRQKAMAEIVEMVYTSHLIHRDILNVSRELITDPSLLDELQYGNKIAILVGDILIANASKMTAELNDCKVLELIATSIGDFMKSEFVVRHDSFGKPFPPRRMDLSAWENRIFLNTGSLLAHACQSVIIMGGHGEAAQRRAREFGRSLGFAWQLHDELEPFVNLLYQGPANPFDLTSFPVVLYLQRNPHILVSLENASSPDNQNVNHIDYADLHAQILSSGVVEEARQRLQTYIHVCLGNAEGFDQCYQAKQALSDIIMALE
ncbi:decaprenyl-diphosphate synthase subunit 2-like [Tropilaelaps mercedesae]|uniref:Decaprenyl-diphosphate synthase subunit 2-like n=1 Tax=Tropilaelaps mercedesae TaxID=418985 RepID=A0A1V9XE44_9ACAR|nr:decaprenyl-diphosphate synthase subunit 2-like [Tropilaelaps mercedesae]